MIFSDLATSAIAIEELCGQEHVKVSSARAELKDIETLADEYSVAHLAVLHFCSNGNQLQGIWRSTSKIPYEI